MMFLSVEFLLDLVHDVKNPLQKDDMTNILLTSSRRDNFFFFSNSSFSSSILLQPQNSIFNLHFLSISNLQFFLYPTSIFPLSPTFNLHLLPPFYRAQHCSLFSIDPSIILNCILILFSISKP